MDGVLPHNCSYLICQCIDLGDWGGVVSGVVVKCVDLSAKVVSLMGGLYDQRVG